MVQQCHALERPWRHAHAAFAIGTLRGPASNSHVLEILPMLALPTRAEAIACLIVFGRDTVLVMAGFSQGMGLLDSGCADRSVQIYRGLMSARAVAAMAIGCIWFAGKSW